MNLINPKLIKAKKALGQNFLKDEQALDHIVETADIQPSDNIIEIGPGLGALTARLAQLATSVTALEIDATLVPLLQEGLKSHPNVTILHQDALTFEPPAHFPVEAGDLLDTRRQENFDRSVPDSTRGSKFSDNAVDNKPPASTPYKIVANIPYYITSPLINHFLQAKNKPQTITLLIQKEVAEKIVAKKQTVLSLQVKLFGTPTLTHTVPAAAFHPQPKVDSAILHIKIYQPTDQNYLPTETALKILDLAKQAYKQGRKKLSNTIPHLNERLTTLNLQDKRPQHLTIKDWQALI